MQAVSSNGTDGALKAGDLTIYRTEHNTMTDDGDESTGRDRSWVRTSDESDETASGEFDASADRPSTREYPPPEPDESDSDSSDSHTEPSESVGTEQVRHILREPIPETITSPVDSHRLDPETIEEYTTERRSLDAAVQIQWGIRTAIGALILGFIASALLGVFNFAPEFGTVVVGVFLVLGVIWVGLRYRVWVYQIREDSVYLERGVITHVRTIVPYVRIQHVDTSRSPLERALGLSTLVVYTAGSRGADVAIPGLQPDEARDLQQRLKELAIEAEGDDAL